MLQPASNPPPQGAAEEGIGDLLHRLVEDGKAYARSEVAYVKTLGTEKVAELKAPVAFGIGALLFAHATFLAFCALIWVALAQAMNAALAGLLTVVILGAVAGLLGYLAYSKLPKSDPKGAAK
ncbi:phage holin family protein [Sphingomonas sp. LHG3406-1]|uniref:phage holin family protein n=1 Tax=Sphingomonas sp. LHG3406-1 TaxID=2804617 RepID=UPI00262B41B4|nr:phage holin family protein [Sphingomonas sp. LHG3406-1]